MRCLLRPHLFYIAVLRGKNVITQVYTILSYHKSDNQKSKSLQFYIIMILIMILIMIIILPQYDYSI